MKRLIKFILFIILMMCVCYIFEWAVIQSIVNYGG